MLQKNKSPLVSVIIPSYNHAKYIASAIQSVLSQTYRNFELIIVDDGSRDDSPKIIQAIQDKRIHFYRQKNQGAYLTINRGISLAKGEYISILNSDDNYHPQRLETCFEYLTSNPDISLVSTWIEVIDNSGRVTDVKKDWQNLLPWSIPDIKHSFMSTNNYNLNLLATNFVSTTSNIFMRKNVVLSIGGMRQLLFAHDWDFLLRAASVFGCQSIQKPLLQYRVHPTNTITQNRRLMLFEIIWVLAANYSKFEGSLLFTNQKKLKKDFSLLYNSMNLQYNDKVFWILRSMIESLRKQGRSENEILEDSGLVSTIVQYIIE